MLKSLFFIIKKIVMAALIIYAYDSFIWPLNIIIPINFFNILLVSVFGIPAMFGLVLFSFVF